MKESRLRKFFQYNILGRILKVFVFPFAMLAMSILAIFSFIVCFIIDISDKENDWFLTQSLTSELGDIFRDFKPKF